jgi:hypothetical protein
MSHIPAWSSKENSSITHYSNQALKCGGHKHDFLNSNGFAPEHFSVVWNVLHMFSIECDLAFTEESKRDFLNFIHLLTVVLFCGLCRKRFEKLLSTYPLTLKTSFPTLYDGYSAEHLMIQIHNAVNCELDKAHLCVSNSNMFEMIQSYRNKQHSSPELKSSIIHVLYMFSLNYPALFNINLPNHKLIKIAYSQWLELFSKYIPKPLTREWNLFYQSKMISEYVVCSAFYMNPKYHFSLQHWLKDATIECSRFELFHIIYYFISNVFKHQPFGDCRETHSYFEEKLRYKS